jgi:hypothetical protein
LRKYASGYHERELRSGMEKYERIIGAGDSLP